MLKLLLKFKRAIKQTLKIKAEIDPKQARRRSSKVIKFLMAVAGVILITLLYPNMDFYGPLDVPREGEIAHENIIADFSFNIMKDNAVLEEERELTELSTPLYVSYNRDIVDNNRENLQALFTTADSLKSRFNGNLPDSTWDRFETAFPRVPSLWLEQLLASGSIMTLGHILDSIIADDIYYYGVLRDLNGLPSDKYKSVIMQKARRNQLFSRGQLVDENKAYNILLEQLNQYHQDEEPINVELAYEIGRHFISPNATYNEIVTEAARDSAVATISDVAMQVNKSDLIARRGARVDAQRARILQAYADQIQHRAAARGWLDALTPLFSRFILVALIILLVFLFLYHFRPDVFWSNNKLFALLLIIGLQLFLVNVIAVKFISTVYLYPIAILSILVSVLYDVRLGVIITLLIALLLGILNRFNFTITLITAVAGCIACFSAGEIRRRSEFYRIILFLSAAYVLIAFTVESLKLSPMGDVLTYCGYGLINGFVAPMLTIGLLPLFESLFGFSTNITLLELADLNQPLLKRLSMEAPGTYHHSLMVGTLAEAAAKAINANPLLARVGAYYHDIGKMEIPEYFVENQLGIKSKHESLNPTMSALVLAAHVKKGRRLGEDAGLPDNVLNFIEEHHGTTMMTYFYNKAREMDLPLESDAEFRYPGPKPQTRETAIAMLADSTEAASRTLDNPTPARIRNLIQKLINDKFSSGELTECNLTLKDLNDIREAFVSILIGVFHQRIEYPKKEDIKV